MNHYRGVSAPKPRPSAWDAWCGTCKYRARIESEDHERHYHTHMLGCGPVWRPRALWGHEWAAVAWMAAAVEIVIEQSGYQPGSLGDPKGEIDELAGLPIAGHTR